MFTGQIHTGIEFVTSERTDEIGYRFYFFNLNFTVYMFNS